MNGHFEYKGYLGSAEIDIDGRALVGRLLFIRDTITYSATSVEGLEKAFRDSVDDYLETCKEEGDEPDKPCKGSFNVRVGEQRHRDAALSARREGVSLNDFVCSALDYAIRPAAATHTVVHRHEHTVTVTTEPQELRGITGTDLLQVISGPARH